LTNHFKPLIKNLDLPKAKPKKVSLPWDEEEIRRLKAQLEKPSNTASPKEG
jgi:hypothetical protein